jgi:hypothetical protein
MKHQYTTTCVVCGRGAKDSEGNTEDASAGRKDIVPVHAPQLPAGELVPVLLELHFPLAVAREHIQRKLRRRRRKQHACSRVATEYEPVAPFRRD